MAQQTPNPIELYEAAAQGFRAAMAAVKEEQMGNSTPCTEWNVQALLNHNIKVTGFAHGILSGQVNVEPMAVSGPVPSEGRLPAFDAGVSQVLDLARIPDAMDKQVETPFGPMTGGQFLMAPFMDLLVHQWDLAKGTGQDTTLDSRLVEVCYTAFAPMVGGMRRPGILGPEIEIPGDASLQDKLIGIMGRHP